MTSTKKNWCLFVALAAGVAVASADGVQEAAFDTASLIETAAAPSGEGKGPAGPGAPTAPSILDMPLPQPTPSMQWGGLPGLGLPPGTAPPQDPLVISVTPGVTEVVRVSATMPNRIATPYENPRVVDASSAQIQTIGNNVFVLPKDDNPFGIFITDEAPGKPVAALTLVPSELASQNIMLQLNRAQTSWRGGGAGLGGERKDANQAHVENLVSLMRAVALGQIPPGFVEADVQAPSIAIGPIKASPALRWSSVELDIYSYALRNTGTSLVELTEQSFFERGVLAVSFYPQVQLAPGAQTRAIVVSRVERDMGPMSRGLAGGLHP